ncbi:MAG: zinc ABC transporter substrate-binding protein [Verrucomicrobiota bacterium]
MRGVTFSVVAGVLLSALLGCQEKGETVIAESGKPVVYVPVAPYEYVFEKIAGDLVDIQVIVGEGDDPHSYSPTPLQVASMSKSQLICSGELGFEGNYFVMTGEGDDAPRELMLLEGLDLLEGHCDHPSHQTETTEDDHDHDHEDLNDPHVWLSPSMLSAQSENIAASLKGLLSEEADKGKIDQNLAAFQKELDAIDAELKEQLSAHQGTKFYVYHGAFAYFGRDYGVEQVALEIGNRKPTPQVLADMAKQAKADNAELIFVQPQFDQSSAQALAESIGGRIEVLDPLEKDIIANLRAIANAIKGG